jgi:hypothetical protein
MVPRHSLHSVSLTGYLILFVSLTLLVDDSGNGGSTAAAQQASTSGTLLSETMECLKVADAVKDVRLAKNVLVEVLTERLKRLQEVEKAAKIARGEIIGIGMLHRRPTLSLTLKDRIEAFRMAAQIAPHRADVHMNLGTALIEAGDRENARKELELAEKLLIQSGDHRLAQSIRIDIQKLKKKQPITSFAYINTSPLSWDF